MPSYVAWRAGTTKPYSYSFPSPHKFQHRVWRLSQNNDLTRGTTELVQHFRLQGEFTSAQERCLT
jgi:hypothetical protein